MDQIRTIRTNLTLSDEKVHAQLVTYEDVWEVRKKIEEV
jgi:hypothetical protein